LAKSVQDEDRKNVRLEESPAYKETILTLLQVTGAVRIQKAGSELCIVLKKAGLPVTLKHDGMTRIT